MGYFGSKAGSGVFQAIIAAMPPHDTYIETHLGSGVVMRAKPRAATQIGIERDPEAMDAFRRTRPWPPVDALYTCDCLDVLQAIDLTSHGRVLIYADPPYVLATRSSAQRYRFDYTDADHRRLIAVLRQVPADVMISGYPSALYDELLGDWRSIAIQAMTRGGVRTEQLWMNFPEGEAHWHTAAGRNRTRRQNIKRKAERWAAHYRRVAPGERLAILAALLAVHAEPPARE